MADFSGDDLSGARFEGVNLTGARFRNVNFYRAVLRGVELVETEIDGDISGLRINGVEVAPLVEAELDRREPDRARMRPTDPAGFREAYDLLERLWDGTVARARRLDPELLHESVDGEWSFVETLRHLVFVTDSWVRRAILGEPAPWHRLALPWDTMPAAGPGWPPSRAYPVRECLLTLLNEGWQHRLYAERDLAVLESR